jgi:SAM-dependent methyltransferase
MPFTTSSATAADEYDRQYRAWSEQQGGRVLDREWRLTHLPWRQRGLLRRYPPEGKRVLDFGCMDGIFAIMLQQSGGEAVGYDISPAAIAQAKAFRGSAARPVFTTVPPGPGQFDIIYCNDVIEHVADDAALIGELVGYLAWGGSVVGTIPVSESPPGAERDLAEDEVLLKRALSAWGRVRLHRYYRSPFRNFLPVRQRGTSVFIFQVTPLTPPAGR